MTLRLLLVRHGLSTFNKEGRIQGRSDISKLATEGKEQAQLVGEALSNIPINTVYTSPLQRAAETAEIINKSHSQEINTIVTKDLLEVDLGAWSGLTKAELHSKFPEAVKTWNNQPKDLVIQRDDGSKFKPIVELQSQANFFIEKLLKSHSPDKEETVLIVAHNAILRCILLKLFNEPDHGFLKLKLDNTSISIININSKLSSNNSVQIECLNSTAHLSPPIPNKGKSSRILLVRHGETDWNKQGRFQGQIDIPLNENGKKQAKSAAEFLKEIQIDRAYSSSMSRPKETAQIILGSHHKTNLIETKKLIEIGHGLWEGQLESEIKLKWSSLLESWHNSPETVQMPEGENITQVSKRSIEGLQEIIKDLGTEQTALVVAHDAVNKTIICHLLGLTPADIWMIKQGNGAITVIDIPPDSSQPNIVRCINITSHLGGILDKTASGAL